MDESDDSRCHVPDALDRAVDVVEVFCVEKRECNEDHWKGEQLSSQQRLCKDIRSERTRVKQELFDAIELIEGVNKAWAAV